MWHSKHTTVKGRTKLFKEIKSEFVVREKFESTEQTRLSMKTKKRVSLFHMLSIYFKLTSVFPSVTEICSTFTHSVSKSPSVTGQCLCCQRPVKRKNMTRTIKCANDETRLRQFEACCVTLAFLNRLNSIDLSVIHTYM